MRRLRVTTDSARPGWGQTTVEDAETGEVISGVVSLNYEASCDVHRLTLVIVDVDVEIVVDPKDIVITK